MLLGPEGSAARTRFGVVVGFSVCGLPEREHDLVVLLCGVGWCFENYTVDASIFVVVKFLRAHGGCLGIRNR